MSCERLNTAQEDRGSRSRGFGKTSDPSNVLGCEIGDLLGDDEKTVREHYSRWVPERQARLTKILKDAFGDKPNLTAIQGGGA